MGTSRTRTTWLAALAAVLVAPMVLAGWRTDSKLLATLSVGLGVLGFSALIVVVIVASRVRALTTVFGVERILEVHRWLGILTVVLVGMHPALGRAPEAAQPRHSVRRPASRVRGHGRAGLSGPSPPAGAGPGPATSGGPGCTCCSPRRPWC